ncbi:hypothetical protein L873DRAFT_1824166 [Choiromyces venosus 120613-1]|uniref:Uncharacterized protein n=1 Tax=Choiromyces venosus 120613-1 TaxID=1336337 RepID=A0A3N4IRB1_9PEZI|nr:hypothetical protein L873DRAFT_1824166 [Choiromyces venosus 120613-1]
MYRIQHFTLASATRPVSWFGFDHVMGAHFQISLFPCRHHTTPSLTHIRTSEYNISKKKIQ